MPSPGREAVSVGVVGCGVAGETHIRGLLRAGAVVTAVCDPDVHRLHACADRYGVKRREVDPSRMLDSADPAAVVLAVPPRFHHPLALLAIQAGKHVLVEKPLATRLADAQDVLAAAARRPDLVVMDCSARHSRLHDKFARVRDWIAAGDIGPVYAVQHRGVKRLSRPGLEYQPDSRWFGARVESGGGPLMDFGVYDLAFHFGVLGVEAQADVLSALVCGGLDRKSRGRVDFDVEEHGLVTMRLPGGIVYQWERATHAHSDESETTRILGRNGGLKLSYPSWHPGIVERFEADDPRTLRIDLGGGAEADAVEDHGRLDAHFLACVRGRETPRVPLAEAVSILAIILAAYDRAGGARSTN